MAKSPAEQVSAQWRIANAALSQSWNVGWPPNPIGRKAGAGKAQGQ